MAFDDGHVYICTIDKLFYLYICARQFQIFSIRINKCDSFDYRTDRRFNIFFFFKCCRYFSRRLRHVSFTWSFAIRRLFQALEIIDTLQNNRSVYLFVLSRAMPRINKYLNQRLEYESRYSLIAERSWNTPMIIVLSSCYWQLPQERRENRGESRTCLTLKRDKRAILLTVCLIRSICVAGRDKSR